VFDIGMTAFKDPGLLFEKFRSEKNSQIGSGKKAPGQLGEKDLYLFIFIDLYSLYSIIPLL